MWFYVKHFIIIPPNETNCLHDVDKLYTLPKRSTYIKYVDNVTSILAEAA